MGSIDKPNFIPVELAEVKPGQRQLKLDPEQTNALISQTAVAPHLRHKRINDAVNTQANLPADAVARGFGMQVSPEMAQASPQPQP